LEGLEVRERSEATQKRPEQKALIVLEGSRAGRSPISRSTWTVTDACICRLVPLTSLAPGIVEAILDGRQPKGLRLAEMLGHAPLGWEVQRSVWVSRWSAAPCGF
jgi:hypothetical protein